jgi:hypothetical protein
MAGRRGRKKDLSFNVVSQGGQVSRQVSSLIHESDGQAWFELSDGLGSGAIIYGSQVSCANGSTLVIGFSANGQLGQRARNYQTLIRSKPSH